MEMLVSIVMAGSVIFQGRIHFKLYSSEITTIPQHSMIIDLF